MKSFLPRLLANLCAGAFASQIAAFAAPEIDIVGLRDGQSTVVNVGTAAVGAPGPSVTFVIKNTGNSSLTLGNITVPAGFVVSQRPASAVSAGRQTSMVLQLDTARAGTPSGKVVIVNNDRDENPFDFPVRGVVSAPVNVPVTVPDIDVIGLVNHQPTPVNLGLATLGGARPSATFVVRNTGNRTLNLGTPGVPRGFDLVNLPASAVAPGRQTSFSVELQTSQAGDFTGLISVPSNDPDENPFEFTVTGTVRPAPGNPEIAVKVNGVPIGSGPETVFRTTTFSNRQGSRPVVVSIQNLGTADLVISDWTLSPGFAAVPAAPGTIRPGGFVDVLLTPNVASLGRRSGTLQFRSNDTDERFFQIQLLGMVFEPEIPTMGSAIWGGFDGEVTIYATPNTRYSIEPANGFTPFAGRYVICSYNSAGGLQSRLCYDGWVRKVVIYRTYGVTADNWTNLTLDLR